ncbi:hypothetical protein AB4Z22_37120, partial [Paenibacillus sp. TAF58]
GHDAKFTTADLFDNGEFLFSTVLIFRHENAPLIAAGFYYFTCLLFGEHINAWQPQLDSLCN